MAISGNDTHSRMVFLLKVILPLAALAILSTLFLISRTIDPSAAIPYATVDVADRIREPRMTAPAYAGVTADGAALTVTADQASPDTGAASALRAELKTPDGASTSFNAANGLLDPQAQMLTLSDGVQITTSTGFVISTQSLISALNHTEVTSDTTITATGPLGAITAGSMALTQTDGAYVLRFKNRVKLIYQPPK